MLKNKLIISGIVGALCLIIFFLSNEFFLLNREHNSNFQKKEKLMKEYSHKPMREINDRPLLKINKDKPSFKYTSDEFQAGMNILIYGQPDISEAKNVFEHLRNLGINSVAINFPFYQSAWDSSEVTTSQTDTPTIEELQEVIEIAHDANLEVMIRPIMDEQVFLASNMWRGQIKPKDPNAWFDSYTALILTYAGLAQSTNAKSLNIGTELNSMQNKYQDKWIELIENVRQVYKGDLLYSFNYDTIQEIPSIEFINLLDHVGIDAYFPLNLPDNASTEMLEEEWKRQINQLKDTLWEKSIIVTEAGIIPVAGAYRTPYAWSLPNRKYDPQAQVNYYEATYNVWKPRVDGIYWWDVTLGQDPNEISFSPLNLPTEEVIKKHFLKGLSDE